MAVWYDNAASREAGRSDGRLRQDLLRVAVLRMSYSEIDVAVSCSGSHGKHGWLFYEFDGCTSSLCTSSLGLTAIIQYFGPRLLPPALRQPRLYRTACPQLPRAEIIP